MCARITQAVCSNQAVVSLSWMYSRVLSCVHSRAARSLPSLREHKGKLYGYYWTSSIESRWCAAASYSANSREIAAVLECTAVFAPSDHTTHRSECVLAASAKLTADERVSCFAFLTTTPLERDYEYLREHLLRFFRGKNLSVSSGWLPRSNRKLQSWHRLRSPPTLARCLHCWRCVFASNLCEQTLVSPAAAFSVGLL